MSTADKPQVQLVRIEFRFRGAKNPKPKVFACLAALKEEFSTYIHAHRLIARETVKVVEEEVTLDAELFDRALKAQNDFDDAKNTLDEEGPEFQAIDEAWMDTFQEFTHYFGGPATRVAKTIEDLGF